LAVDQELADQFDETISDDTKGPVTTTKKSNYLPLLIGGAAVVYLISRK
jgi:hypothetical protein